MAMSARVLGETEMAKAILTLKPKLVNRVVRSAFRKGASQARKHARSNARTAFERRSGLLMKAIKAGVTRTKRTKEPLAKVFVDPKVSGEYKGKKVRPSKYAHLVEKGTKRLAKGAITKAGSPAKRTHHATRPRPFFEGAFNHQDVFEAILAEGRKQFNRVRFGK